MRYSLIPICLILGMLSPALLCAQQTVGVFKYEDGVWGDYTLFNPLQSKTTYLIDHCGRVVHRWESEWLPGIMMYLHDDGKLYRSAKVPGAGGYAGNGGHIEILDWNSNVLWSHDFAGDEFRQHHDFEIMPNGNILILGREKLSTADATAAGRDPSTLDNSGELGCAMLREIRTIGSDDLEIIWEWRLCDHLIQDFDPSKSNYGVVGDHPELMDVNYFDWPDDDVVWNHINSVDYNESLDQIVITSRNQHEFWIIDHSTTTAEAAGHSGGDQGKGGDFLYRFGNPEAYDQGSFADRALFGPHDAHWIEDSKTRSSFSTMA